jgi:hypothetical protein
MRDGPRETTIAQQMVAFAEHDLDSVGEGPGLPLGALRPLVALPPEDRPDDLDDILRRVADKYGDDPHIIDSVADLRSRLVDDSQRKELRRERVKRWRAEAADGDGMLRVHRLEQALEIARDSGLAEEAAELRRELGAIRPDELGLQHISTELEIPGEDVARFLQSFEQAASWQDALRSLAVQGPPGGTPQELADYVDEMMEDSPLQFLFTKVLVGPDNATAIFRAASPEDHRRLALAEQCAQQARMWGGFCAQALQRIGHRDDRPTHSALTEFLEKRLHPSRGRRAPRAQHRTLLGGTVRRERTRPRSTP